MRPLTKVTHQIVTASAIPTMVRDAFRIAAEERPGPVHLELPEDIAAEEVDAPLVPPHPIDRPYPNPAALERVASMILRAKAPLIMIGAAGSRPRLAQLPRRMGRPQTTTIARPSAVTQPVRSERRQS